MSDEVKCNSTTHYLGCDCHEANWRRQWSMLQALCDSQDAQIRERNGEISALKNRVAELEGALWPFANVADQVVDIVEITHGAGAVARARACLGKIEKGVG